MHFTRNVFQHFIRHVVPSCVVWFPPRCHPGRGRWGRRFLAHLGGQKTHQGGLEANFWGAFYPLQYWGMKPTSSQFSSKKKIWKREVSNKRSGQQLCARRGMGCGETKKFEQKGMVVVFHPRRSTIPPGLYSRLGNSSGLPAPGWGNGRPRKITTRPQKWPLESIQVSRETSPKVYNFGIKRQSRAKCEEIVQGNPGVSN